MIHFTRLRQEIGYQLKFGRFCLPVPLHEALQAVDGFFDFFVGNGVADRLIISFFLIIMRQKVGSRNNGNLLIRF